MSKAEEKHLRMRCDLHGLIANIRAEFERRDTTGYCFMLGTLANNLQEMADRWRRGDSSGVEEFIDLYCLDRPSAPSTGAQQK